MRKLVHLTTAAVLMASLSCQSQPQHQTEGAETKTEETLPPLHLGAVHQVYPQQGFVLLRIIGPLPAPGTVLITHPADGSRARVSNLIVTADQPSRNRMIIAEIRSGNVAQGDRVFMYRTLAQPVEKPDEVVEQIPTEAPIPTEKTPESILNDVEDISEKLPEGVEDVTVTEPKKKPHKETKTPDHIFDIPDNIDDWD